VNLKPNSAKPGSRLLDGPWLLPAFAWGLAEATLFFIVPDVLLTWIATRDSARAGFGASFSAALGAMAGGGVLLCWMHYDTIAVINAVIALPGINAVTLAEVTDDVGRNWFGALIAGAFTGIPYKLFAIKASETGLTASVFLLASFLARLPRFLLVVWAADFLAVRLRKWEAAKWVSTCWLIWWLAFYAFYFYEMGW
jgi:membrane protein YqaA with SNARE-associated domain